MSKLSELRGLKQSLAFIEEQRTGIGDREAAVQALTAVVDYLDKVHADAASLRGLLAAFHVKDSPLLDIAGSQAMSPVEESLCGKIAGVAFLKSRTNGKKTRKAAEWVAKNLPQNLHKCLAPPRSGRVSWRAVYAWGERWGGDHGDPGIGREGYRMIVEAGTRNPAKLPADQALVNILNTLAGSPGLPSN
jgi:hypothetical protein